MPRYSALPLLLSLLFSCVPSYAADNTSAPDQDPLAADQGYDPADLPKTPLTNDILGLSLLGDIAMQRGSIGLGAQSWLEVAKLSRDPRAARRATEYALLAQNNAEALEACSLWVETAPKTKLARQFMLLILIRNHQIEAIVPHLDMLLGSDTAETAAFLLNMDSLWDQKTDRDAVLRLNNLLLERYGALPEAWFARSVTYNALEQYDKALADLDHALTLRPNWPIAVLYKGQTLGLKQDTPAQIDWLKKAIATDSKQASYYLELARALVHAERYTEAGKTYDAALAQWPTNREALFGAGILAFREDRFDDAEQYLQAALKAGLANPDMAYVYLGQIAETRLQYREALNWYAKIQSPSEASKVAYSTPRLLAKLGEGPLAEQAAAALPESTPEARLEKAIAQSLVWRELKQYQKGLDTLTAELAKQPKAGRLLLERSQVFDLQGNYTAAESDLRRYLADNPDDAGGLNALGYTLVSRTQRLDEAALLLERAYALEPNNTAIIDSMGWLRYRQGRLEEARGLLEHAYARYQDPEIAAHYIEVLWQTGEQRKARAIYDTIIKRVPDDALLLAVKQKLGL